MAEVEVRISTALAKEAAIRCLRAASVSGGRADWYAVGKLVHRADPEIYSVGLDVLTVQRFAQQRGIAETLNVIALAVVAIGDSTKPEAQG